MHGARGDELTVSQDNLRTGWDQHEPNLGPAQVASSTFGQQFATQLTGQIYAQPIVVGGNVIVATEENNVYSVNGSTGAIQWSVNLGPSWPASAIGCSDLQPDLGITSTPVYDPATNAIYLVSKDNNGPNVQNPNYYMHALNPSTGADLPGWPVTIAGTPANDPGDPFNAMHEGQRPGLLLLDGAVYAAFGSHCDFGPYRGYVVGVSTSTAKMTAMWATEQGSANNGGGIWGGGGGLVSDGSGRIFFSTGNGVAPPAAPGSPVPATLSESVVRLQVNSDGSLTPADFFSPANAPTLDQNDTDLGSGGPVALPDGFGTAQYPHVLLQQGKDGRIFILNRDSLGGRSQGTGGTDNVLGTVGPYQGQWGHPAVWPGDGGYVYFVDNGGPLRAFKSGSVNGVPTVSLAGTSSSTFPYTSGSPVVTSNGTTSGSGVVWAVWSSGPDGGNSTLRAYSAVPGSNGQMSLLYSAPIGTASKFMTPASDGNRVFVGTRDGKLLAFGSPANTVLTGSPVDFGSVATGTTTSKTLTLTAQTALTVNSVTTSSPFGVTPPTLPLNMNAGDVLQLPVTFAPANAGPANAIVAVATSSGNVGFSLTGSGTQPGLSATPSSVDFGQLSTGATKTINVQVNNTGTAAETVSASTAPASPFTVTGLPANGTAVAAGGSFVLAITYAPTAAASDSSSVSITSTSGTINIPLTGSAVAGSGHLTIAPATTDFGQVNMGSSLTRTFNISNTGNLPLTITKAKAPTGDYSTTSPLAEGTVIGPGQTVQQTVTFTPSRPGVQTANYELTPDTGQGAQNVPLTGIGMGAVPAPNATNWSVNGSAALNSSGLQLTPVLTQQAGSAFYNLPVPTDGLNATFTVQIGPGTGADGMTLALLDPAKQGPASVGKPGSALGFGGLTGVSTDLVTFWNSQTGSNNMVAVAPGPGTNGNLTWSAWAKAPTSLKAGTHTVNVAVSGGKVQVTLDGTVLFNQAMTLPPNAYVGFTGATGSGTDSHIVTSAQINTAQAATPGQPLTASPASVDLGYVGLGTTATANVTLTNSGGQTETVSSTASPNSPWSVTLPAAGATVAPGASITVPVTFAPTVAGTYPDSFTVSTTSGNVKVPLNGSGKGTLPAISDPSWQPNGFTTVSGNTATLTLDGQKFGAGSIVNSKAVSPLGLTATFTAQIGGSQTVGADGLTMALLDASTATTSSLGGQGNGVGVVGLPATFVALETYPSNGIDTYNFAAIGTSASGATAPTWVTSNTTIPDLRTGTHTVKVTVSQGSQMTVLLDGTQIMVAQVTLPSKVLVAFTAGVGGSTDTHAVTNPIFNYIS